MAYELFMSREDNGTVGDIEYMYDKLMKDS